MTDARPDSIIELSPAPPHMPGAVVWFGFALFAMLGFFVFIFGGTTFVQVLLRILTFLAVLAAVVGGIRLRTSHAQRRLRLGADGIHVGRSWGSDHFVPWDEVVGLTRGVAHRFYLKTKDTDILLGTDIDLGRGVFGPPVKERPTWAPGLEGDTHLADVIALATSHCVRGGSRCLPVLEGAERSEWERLLKEAMNSNDYRGRGLTRADLLADLDQPSVDPELRALIARMLRPRLDEVESLEQTLNATAAPQVRVALEETLEEVRHQGGAGYDEPLGLGRA